MPIDLLADDSSQPVDLLADEGISHHAPSKGFFGNLMDYEKGLGLGLLQGAGDVGSSIGNFPSSIYEHFTGKQPYHIPHPALQKYYPEGTAGTIGSTLGEMISPFAVPGFGQARAANLAKTIGGKALARMSAGGALGAAESEGNRAFGSLVGAGASTIPAIFGAASGAYKAYKQPFKALEENTNLKQILEQALKERASSFQQAEHDVGRHLQQKNEANLFEGQNLEDKLSQKYPIIPKSETRAALATEHANVRKKLEGEFKDRYESFSQEHGKKPIKQTMDFNDFLHDTKDLKGLSGTISELRKNPNKKIIRYETSGGDTKDIAIPQQGATVDDYIGFMRELRDASYDALSASKNATHSEKMDLLKTYKKLGALQNDVETRIKNTIGKNQYEPFEKIQRDYAGTIGRIKTEPSLRKASYGRSISDSLFNDLLQPSNEQLRQYLYKNPNYVESLRNHLLQGAKHPISEGASFNPTKIDADIYKLLSPEQRIAKSEAHALEQQKQSLKDVAKSIKNPSLMTSIQEQQARQFSPEVNSFLDRVSHEGHINKQMIDEGKKLGLTEEKLKQQIANRQQIKTIAGIAAAMGIIPPFAKKIYNAAVGG